MTINLERRELCDLLAACNCAKRHANDDGAKWDAIKGKLKKQLNDYDNRISVDFEKKVEIIDAMKSEALAYRDDYSANGDEETAYRHLQAAWTLESVLMVLKFDKYAWEAAKGYGVKI